MVQFNPFFRPSIEECLAHPYFSKIRKPHVEVESENPVEVEIDKLEYEPNCEQLRDILLEEADFFKEKRAL